MRALSILGSGLLASGAVWSSREVFSDMGRAGTSYDLVFDALRVVGPPMGFLFASMGATSPAHRLGRTLFVAGLVAASASAILLVFGFLGFSVGRDAGALLGPGAIFFALVLVALVGIWLAGLVRWAMHLHHRRSGALAIAFAGMYYLAAPLPSMAVFSSGWGLRVAGAGLILCAAAALAHGKSEKRWVRRSAGGWRTADRKP